MTGISPIKHIAASILAATRFAERPSDDLPPLDPPAARTVRLLPGDAHDTMAGLPTGDRLAYLADIVELQRAELNRLLLENRRLNDRVDQMVKLQEREQVLRQQMQATLQHMTPHAALRAPDMTAHQAMVEQRARDAEDRYRALKQSVAHLVAYLQRISTPPERP